MGITYYIVTDLNKGSKRMFKTIKELKSEYPIFSDIKKRGAAKLGLVDNIKIDEFDSVVQAENMLNKSITEATINPITLNTPEVKKARKRPTLISRPGGTGIYVFRRVDDHILNTDNDLRTYLVEVEKYRKEYVEGQGTQFIIMIRYTNAVDESKEGETYRSFDVSTNRDFDLFKKSLLKGKITSEFTGVVDYEKQLSKHARFDVVKIIFNEYGYAGERARYERNDINISDRVKIPVLNPNIKEDEKSTEAMIASNCLYVLLSANFTTKKQTKLIKDLFDIATKKEMEKVEPKKKGDKHVYVKMTRKFIGELEEAFETKFNFITRFESVIEPLPRVIDDDPDMIRITHMPVYHYKSKYESQRVINFYAVNGHLVQLHTFPRDITEKDLIFDLPKDDPIGMVIPERRKFKFEPPRLIFYDYETVYDLKLRRHVPYLLSTIAFDELEFKEIYYRYCFGGSDDLGNKDLIHGLFQKAVKKVFFNESCTKECIEFYEELYNDMTRFYIGFNSAKFDVYFIIDYLFANDRNPKVTVFKDKLYCEDGNNIFLDLLPMMTPNSLASHCEAYKTTYKKKSGAISFKYLNEIYNKEADNNINSFKDVLKDTLYEGDLSRNVYEVLVDYCNYDVYSLADLYGIYSTNMAFLVKKVIDSTEIETKGFLVEDEFTGPGFKFNFNFRHYKTLGQLSMSLILSIHYIPDSDELSAIRAGIPVERDLISKTKRNKYKYSAVLNEKTSKETEDAYIAMRSGLLASVSYSESMYKNETDTFCLSDVVSLYPYVMMSKDNKYGYGPMKRIIFDAPYITNDPMNNNLNLLDYGIYRVKLEYTELGFHRIPFKAEEMAYQWKHDGTIERWLYYQDIIETAEKDPVKVTVYEGYQFEHSASGYDIFGLYMKTFADEKNRQDVLKGIKDASYNGGLRECCKAWMNILSGKFVQVYSYAVTMKVEAKHKFAKNPSLFPKNTRYSETDSYLIYEKEQALITDKTIYDFSLVGGQLYTYSRKHMFDNVIKPCLDLAEKSEVQASKTGPIIIETDSITCTKQLMDQHRELKPMMRNVDGTIIPLYCEHGQLKQFGQLEIEYHEIKNIYTYFKKSYCFDHEPDAQGTFKLRFKGVIKDAMVMLSEEDLLYYSTYNLIKRLLEQCEKVETNEVSEEDKKEATKSNIESALVKKLIMTKFAEISSFISRWYSNRYMSRDNVLKDPPIARKFFDNLIQGKPTTIVQSVIKKNLITSNKQALSLENLIIVKTFNNDEKPVIPSKKLARSYMKVFDKVGQITLIPSPQIDV